MKFIKAIEIATGRTVSVQYAHNRLGNLRMWVDGKFYSDNDFAKKFKLITETEEA